MSADRSPWHYSAAVGNHARGRPLPVGSARKGGPWPAMRRNGVNLADLREAAVAGHLHSTVRIWAA